MKKTILNQVKEAVCRVLNVDENLMFSKFRETRLDEARKYICYLGILQGVDAVFVSRYLGYAEARYSIRNFTSVENHIHLYGNSQLCTDIEKIYEILNVVEPV